MSSAYVVILMLGTVLLSGVLVRVLPFSMPLPLLQIGLGILIAAILDEGIILDPDVFFLLFLPPLLFLDGWRIPKDALRRDWGSITLLAVALVFLTVGSVGFLIHWMVPAMPLPVAFALAAIISPTDPVAVEGITRRLLVPRRTMAILQGEALFNDASGLVTFRLAVSAMLTGAFSLGEATLSFLWVALAGIATGFLVTRLILWLRGIFTSRFGEETALEVLLSLLTPFVAYLAAEQIQASGILAAVVAGVTMSRAELSGRASAMTRMRRHIVWDMVQFTLNGMMFVLLGEQLPRIYEGAVRVVEQTGHHEPGWLAIYAVVICVALAAVRFVCVWGVVQASRLWRGRASGGGGLTMRALAVLSLGGVRGAVTLAGVMTLPLVLTDGQAFPARDLAIFLAATVIIFSLIAAAIGLPLVLRGFEPGAPAQADAERELAWTSARQAAMARVQAKSEELIRAGTQEEAEGLAHATEHVLIELDELLGMPLQEQVNHPDAGARSAQRTLRREALAASREAVYALARERRISDALARELVRRLDLEEVYLS